MRIGVDFDNTIVCYDALFHQVALEQGLIPATLPVNKSAVRDYLRAADQEDAWTAMQGYVYGLRMIAEADPYPGVRAFFAGCQAAGQPVCIISHKTQYPYLGERYDLHAAARAWLAQHEFDTRIGIQPAQVYLELTKAEKLQRIGQAGCTHFIDDLPEFLLEATFPAGVQRILFDPNDIYPDQPDYWRATTWPAIQARLLHKG